MQYEDYFFVLQFLNEAGDFPVSFLNAAKKAEYELKPQAKATDKVLTSGSSLRIERA